MSKSTTVNITIPSSLKKGPESTVFDTFRQQVVTEVMEDLKLNFSTRGITLTTKTIAELRQVLMDSLQAQA